MRTLLLAALAAAAPLAAQNYSSAPAGDGCNGAVLTATFTPVGNNGNHNVAVDAANLHAGTVALMICGIQPALVPLPGYPGCFAHTIPIWTIGGSTDNSGNWHHHRSWPVWALGTYYVQVGTIDTGTNTLRVTNCLALTLQ